MSEQQPGIAIVGMSGRFPGAPDVETFWENVKAGRDSVTRFGADDLDPLVEELATDTDYVCAKGMLDGIDQFDAGFFGVLPRDAEVMDPQHRVFLEICWEAIEGAGYDPSRYEGAIGCFGGCYMDTYLLHNLCADDEFRRRLVQSIQVGTLQTELGNDKDYLATRVAFKLGLRGPAINMQTACSTSLVAIATACQSLESYTCDMALAGGVTIVLPQFKGYQYKEGSMLSPDGTCRPFDADAAGTVFSNGAAVVLLKRLDDALADGDTIHAVIRGYATNNDGDGKVSYTAPSPEGQAEVISLALGMADIDARTIGLVEAHGTATPLGDPIEVAGLSSAYRQYTDETQYCALGSVKANLGHLDVASGAIGVIKASMSLRDGVIPPLAHFKAPNPKIDFASSPFYIPTALSEWPETTGPKRAGVSSFGVGGTNAHVVIEEPPAMAAGSDWAGPCVLPFSARTERALEQMADGLVGSLSDGSAPLSDVAATLQRGRKVFARRGFAVAGGDEPIRPVLGEAPAGSPRIGFLFTGQGAQYPGMGAELYEQYPAYRDVIDRVCAALAEERPSLKSWLLDPASSADDLTRTENAQVALFAVEVAMAALLGSMGIKPEAVIGHSVGEVAAAVEAGVFTLEGGARFVCRRAQLMGVMPTGAMLGVRADHATTEAQLKDGAVIAGVNGPAVTVVSGTFEAIDATASALEAAGLSASRLAVSHGFHSPSMQVAADALGAPVGAGAGSDISIYSTLTGEETVPGRYAEAAYWREQMLSAVLFAPAIEAAAEAGIDTFIEVGPGTTLTALSLQAADDIAAFPTLGGPKQPGDARAHFLGALGHLWSRGGELDWDAVQPGPFRRVPLPTYPFQRKRYWVEPAETERAAPVMAAAPPTPAQQPAPQGTSDSLTDLVRQQLAVVEAQLASLRGQ